MSGVTYYRIEKAHIPEPKEGEVRFESAAFWNCALCGAVIKSTGGPGYGDICEPCGDALQAGKLVGAVVWSTEGER